MSRARDIDCPKCGAKMLKSYATEAKFRAKLIKWDRSGMYAICKGCNTDVAISVDLMKSIQSSFVFEVDKKAE
jgi:transcription elongation factor Elf1